MQGIEQPMPAITALRPDTRAIIQDVCERHDVRFDELLSETRSRSIVIARCAAIRAVKRLRPHYSLPMLGRIFQKDHATIAYHLHALRESRRCKCDRYLATAKPAIEAISYAEVSEHQPTAE